MVCWPAASSHGSSASGASIFFYRTGLGRRRQCLIFSAPHAWAGCGGHTSGGVSPGVAKQRREAAAAHPHHTTPLPSTSVLPQLAPEHIELSDLSRRCGRRRHPEKTHNMRCSVLAAFLCLLPLLSAFVLPSAGGAAALTTSRAADVSSTRPPAVAHQPCPQGFSVPLAGLRLRCSALVARPALSASACAHA